MKFVTLSALLVAILALACAEQACGQTSGLDAWREKRVRDFWNPTSPFFGDPYYDPMKTSPFSPFRSPQYHPYSTSPFRGDPYYDPYAPRRGRLDFYRRR
jgi:hypothetical protein